MTKLTEIRVSGSLRWYQPQAKEECMLLKKVVNDHVEGNSESHSGIGQEKVQPLPKKKQQERSGSGPIEIRIYEDQSSDSGRMMLKISFAKQEIRRFTRR